MVNSGLKLVYFNTKFSEHFSLIYKTRLCLGASMPDIISSFDSQLAQRWKKLLSKTLNTGHLRFEESYVIGGNKQTFEFRLKKLSLGTGDIGVSVYAFNITDQKKYEQSIKQNEANLRSILDNTDSAIWLIDNKLQLIEFNRSFVQFWKTLNGDHPACDEKLIRIPNSNDLTSKFSLWYRCIRKKKPFTKNLSVMLSGHSHIFNIEAFPIIKNGIVNGATFFAHDITEKQSKEETLQKKNEELERLNKQFDELVYSASHDLRSPITSSRGLINLMRIDMSRSNTENCLNLIETSLNKLDNIVREITLFSKTSRSRVHIEKINTYSFINECVESQIVKEGVNGSNISFQIDAKRVKTIYSDQEKLKLAINNLINNAIRFRDPRKQPQVKIKVTYVKKKIKLEIADNGIGIPLEHQSKIFDMFYKAHETSQGPGLGLFVASEAINRVKGSIRVYSEPGIGSKFEIEFSPVNSNNLRAAI